MIIERDTQRYTINASKMIDSAFESAYSDEQDGPVVTKPDFAVTVCGTISMLIIAAMCFMTYLSKGKETLWMIIAVVCVLLPVYFFYKDFKKLAQYKAVNSVDTSKYAAKQAFRALFGENIAEKMSATDFLRIVNPLAAKPAILKNSTSRDGVRFLINALNSKNNPTDLLCKNVTAYGKVLMQTRHRYYAKREDNSFVFYDQDFMNPAGEIVCDEKDIISFGRFSLYPVSINKSGGKINPDDIIVEIETGSSDKLYFQINGKEYDRAKKLFKGIKEIK